MVVDDPAKNENDLYRVKSLPSDGKFSINPGETYKLYARETLNVPADVFSIAIPVGNMYKLGLNPETTFADPGFSNAFYITVCNYSRRVVTLKVGDPLARLFFFKLSSRPDRIHESNPREVPPAVVRLAKRTPTELEASDERSLLKAVLEDVDPPHYEHAFVTNRLLTTRADATAARLQQVEKRSAITLLMGALLLLLASSLVLTYAAHLLYVKYAEFAINLFASFAWALVGSVGVIALTPLRRYLLDAVKTLQSPQ